jgi:NAD(P)-dependent dehydrogenase (short-subunit alcohol dehydrogenase family)
VATPEHVAQAVMGFVRSDLVTGQHLVVDGGLNLTY